jgi:predicted DNA binding CopG/RHH family protein
MSIEMDNGSPSHITSRTVVVLEHRSGDVASLGSSLKHAADVVHETLGLDPKRSVLLRAGAASDGGDESEQQQQQHEAEEHEVVAATAMAYLVAGAKLSLRVAVEQLTTVLGSDRVQRMGDSFKRQLMAIETHVSRRPPSHDFFAPPSPTANVEAVASAPAPTQSGPATVPSTHFHSLCLAPGAHCRGDTH